MKNFLKKMLFWFSQFFFDPFKSINNWRALPFFIQNLYRYSNSNPSPSFKISFKDLYFTSGDRFSSSGTIKHHYFHQDLWASQHLYNSGVKEHIDIGSRLDGFVLAALSFAHVKYVDIRPLQCDVNGLTFIQGSILKLPFESNSIKSLSCLHVLEHIGLGRYSDPVMPEGHIIGAKELQRVLDNDGVLLFSTPVGKEKLCFDAHRVFSPYTIVEIFNELTLEAFHLIGDKAEKIQLNASLDDALKCNYGCGLFVFRRKAKFI